MYFGKNLQVLRKMTGMTQEALAEKMNVSRQTVSKWETDSVYPEIDKLIELCSLFNCSVDQLLREDMSFSSEAYSEIRIVCIKSMRYIRYAVISRDPESDAISHVRGWAQQLDIADPEIIGWDFPMLSQEQINVFHMHGYAAALVLPENKEIADVDAEVLSQPEQRYVVITIKDPMAAPFVVIPNAYKALMMHIAINGIKDKRDSSVICCFEKEYCDADGVDCMDVYIAIE